MAKNTYVLSSTAGSPEQVSAPNQVPACGVRPHSMADCQHKIGKDSLMPSPVKSSRSLFRGGKRMKLSAPAWYGKTQQNDA